ncbi:MAG: hypothetical protein KAG66_19115, partial [Methylococcales bacterium]|nr:hypothetical protein [Methylococcales bacterium]
IARLNVDRALEPMREALTDLHAAAFGEISRHARRSGFGSSERETMQFMNSYLQHQANNRLDDLQWPDRFRKAQDEVETFAAAYNKVNADDLVANKQADLFGAKAREHEDGYMPRNINGVKVETAEKQYGKEALEQAFIKANMARSGQTVRQSGVHIRTYLQTLKDVGARDKSTYAVSRFDKVALSNLHTRIELDMTTEVVPGVTLGDVFPTDLMNDTLRAIREATGLRALAGKFGVRSRAGIGKLREIAMDEATAGGMPIKDAKSLGDKLDHLLSDLLGDPAPNEAAAGWNHATLFTTTTLLAGTIAKTQLLELPTMMVSLGTDFIPALRSLFNNQTLQDLKRQGLNYYDSRHHNVPRSAIDENE